MLTFIDTFNKNSYSLDVLGKQISRALAVASALQKTFLANTGERSMRVKGFSGIILIVLFMLALSACGGDTETPEATAAIIPTATTIPAPTALTEPLFGLATVESVEVQIAESTFPVQVSLRVRGVLANSCTEIDTIIAQQNGSTFDVAITTVQQPDQVCTQAVVPFEEIVPLDVEGLSAGTYTVDVNSIQGSFTLDVDNVIVEATAVPTPTVTADEGTYVVNGRVWHDLCAVPTGEVTELPDGCVTTGDGTFRGNGELEDEPGIEGVRVTIGAGECPSAGLGVTTTDADGNYNFDGLNAGTYCIVVDTFDPENDAILNPGIWTAPPGDSAKTSITVGADSTAEPVNFGWDFQFLPVTEADLSSCENSFVFVEDLTIPDDTEFPPGAEFTKEWRLRNNGTCPWTEEYSVVFVSGDQMSAAESSPLPKTVGAGQTVDIAIDMIAPETPGTYRGNFQIADPTGEPFGLNGVIEDAFFLRIIVAEDAEPQATALPNSAAIGGIVWDDFCINSAPGRGCIDSDGGSIGDGNQDGLEAGLSGITISLARNACPADGSLPAATAVLETAVTDEDGRYLFENLSDATYCIFMDALSPENLDLLIPGNWTWPATGVGLYSFILDPGEQALDLDFGWDFVD